MVSTFLQTKCRQCPFSPMSLPNPYIPQVKDNAGLDPNTLKTNYKQTRTINDKSMQIQSTQKKCSNIALKIDLGGSWAPSGRPLGCSRASLGRFWVPLAHLLHVQNVTFSKHWSKMCSNKPFGSIWGGFGRGMGGFGSQGSEGRPRMRGLGVEAYRTAKPP